MEWSTKGKNYAHADFLGRAKRYGSKSSRSKLIEQDVIRIRKRVRAGERVIMIHKDYKDRISLRSFRDICNGIFWTKIS